MPLSLAWSPSLPSPTPTPTPTSLYRRASRLGFECFFDVALLPLWLCAFYFGGFESEGGWNGPIIALCRSPVIGYLGRW
jgi:hypothetical protein